MNNPEENTLPTSNHIEVAVLGAMLLDVVAQSDAIGTLETDDFALDSHQRVYRCIVAMQAENIYVDSLSVQDELIRRKELDSIGGPAYLAFLTEGIPRNFSIENYVRILKDKSNLRRLMHLAHNLSIRASDDNESPAELAAWGATTLNEIMAEGESRDSVYDAPTMARDAEERLITNPSDDEVIPTGIPSLDEFTGGGIRLGELWIVGASPSRGKTTLARQIIKNVVFRDTPAYVHSGEMSKESWFDVTACLLEGMPTWKIREPRLMNLTERERLLNGIRDLAKMPLFISDTGGIHIDRLIWNATQAILRHGCKLMAYDYAQIIKASGNDKEKVSAVAHRLRQFHKDTKTAGILLSQSPRPDGKFVNAKPTMFSLKESGSLEEAAHTVILPYRPIDIETGKFTGEDELIIGKQRWGSIGSIPIHLNGAYLRFDERGKE